MASNRGPNAIGSSTNSVAPPQQNSEYYKAAQATSGSAFQWAGTRGAATTSNAAPAQGLGSVGGSWGAAAAVNPSQSQMSVASRARAEAHGTLPAAPSAPVGTVTSNGEYEKNLIAELCPPGGMKAEPPKDKLAEFARAVPSLNPDSVCPALLDALEEGNPWIMRAKALCVIETVLKVMAATEGSNAYADFFYACSGEIAPLANHARAAVKGPAKRVLDLLGLEGDAVITNDQATVAEPVAAAPNLLDLDEPSPVVAAPFAPPQPVQTTAQPAVSNGGNSLFSGLSTKTEASAPPPAAPAPAPPTQEEDLLGGFDIAAAPEPMPVNNTAAAPSNSLFGDMNVKSTENGEPSEKVSVKMILLLSSSSQFKVNHNTTFQFHISRLLHLLHRHPDLPSVS